MAVMPPTPHHTPGLMHVPKGHPSTGSTGLGWLVFAAFGLTISAAVNIAWGIVALADDFYWNGDAVAGHASLWGWVWIGFAVVELSIAGLVLMHNSLGLVLGIGVASINAIGHISAIAHYPAWSIAVIAADVLVIYALARPWFKHDW